MLLNRLSGSKRLCVYLGSNYRSSLNKMTVTTVTSDPRITARQPHQQQEFSTISSSEASGNSFYRPVTGNNSTEVSTEHRSNNHQSSKTRSNSHGRAGDKNDSFNDKVYVLTLLTNPEHHKFMSALRKRYFPPKMHKVDAHITLFHALPEERLQIVISDIEDIASKTTPYRIEAHSPSRMTQGFKMMVSSDVNRDRNTQDRNPVRRPAINTTKSVHSELQRKWSEFLSDQDSWAPRSMTHYTIMNKVSDEAKCEQSLQEVNDWIKQGSVPRALLKADGPGELDESQGQAPLQLTGVVQGLTLWRYAKGGRWVEPRHFEFGKEAPRSKE